MVETSVEVMNSLFMQTYEQRAVLSHTDYLLDAEKVWSDLVAKLSYCWFSHRLRAQHSETGRTWRDFLVELGVCLFSVFVLGPVLSSYLSTDRLEVRTRWPMALETRTP